MLKYLQTALFGVALSACAAAPEANTSTNEVVEVKEVENVPHDKNMDSMDDKPDRIFAENAPSLMTLWQKQPGTAVYNNEGDIVGNLRLRPTVSVYEVKEGWSRIHPENNKWVKTSDLTDIKPDDVPIPRESTGLEDIDQEGVKRAVETGVRPGDQE